LAVAVQILRDFHVIFWRTLWKHATTYLFSFHNHTTGMDYQGDMGGGGNYGGGFDNSSGGFNSGGGGGGGTPKARKAYDEQTIIPVTARMIIQAQSGENGLTLQDGRELHHVKFIGAVRSHEDASTNATFSIEDGTGLVDVKQWVDANDCPAIIEMRQECMQENVYVKVIGSLKDYDGKKTLVAHTVRRLSTSNELTHHMLEVVYSSEKYQRKQSIVGGAMPHSMAGGGVGFGGVHGGGAPVAQASSGDNAGDKLRNQVLNFIRDEGSKWLLCVHVFLGQ
jgi:replication factor A2